MKRLLILLTILILACANRAFAQGGSIGLFSSAVGVDWCIEDNAATLCNVYVIHAFSPGLTASEFGVSTPNCIQASFLSYTPQFAVDIAFDAAFPLAGRSVGYGGCLSTPIHVATLAYFCQALTPPCCLQSVIPHAGTGSISAVDCLSLLSATGGSAIWNPNPTCSCKPAAHTSTWGKVKSMYQ